MLEFGIVNEINESHAVATVNILSRTTDWLPILTVANSFKKHFIPIRVGEQVAVLEDRIILGSLFHKGCSEPEANNSKEVITYEDGTTISYDTKTKDLSINAAENINIKCKNLNIDAKKTAFTGEEISHDGKDISKKHNHPQNDGNHFGGDINTSPPNKV